MNRSLRTLCALLIALIARFLIGLGPFSGQGDLRKGGDFEAQRHWMEIAVNTPPPEWYVQTETNDLSWWGLDYPPLSAYWAYITGRIAKKINPAYVELLKSRRLERDGIKEFMRATVVAADILFLIPAFLMFASNRSYSAIMILWSLLNPALLLVDHGHFQYNNVMLGLIVLAVVMLLDYKRQLVATALVCSSVCFKQMGLYVVPTFLVFLLRQCIRHRERGLRLFFLLGLTAVGTTALCFLPFLSEFPKHFIPVLHRIFPLHRGLFEDKVANFWWALATLTKFNAGRTQDELVKLCSVVLLLALSPSLISLLVSKPSGNRFLYALAYSTLCFFMFAYHVHEKNILVPQVAVLLISHLSPIFVFWFSCLSALSLFQLMQKDGLELYYFAMISCWLVCSKRMYRYIRFSWSWCLVIVPTMISMYLLPICQLALSPSDRYPHLYHVLAMLGCSASYLLCLAYLLYKQFTCESHYYYTHRSLLSTS